MLYNLATKIDQQRAKNRLEILIGDKCVIELRKKEKRSLSQNSYLHLILCWFARETGYTLEEAKMLYKYKNAKIYEYKKDEMTFYRSSADLDSKEMTITIDEFRDYSNIVTGIYLPTPNEQDYLQEIEIELSKKQTI